MYKELRVRLSQTEGSIFRPLTVSSAPVTNLLTKHIPSHINPFSPIVTRDFRPPKPSPAAISHIAQAWSVMSEPSVQPGQEILPMIMVGDSIDDMVAGHEAGALTVLLRSEGKEDLEKDERTDIAINRYACGAQT